jgi:hypothetical protein
MEISRDLPAPCFVSSCIALSHSVMSGLTARIPFGLNYFVPPLFSFFFESMKILKIYIHR